MPDNGIELVSCPEHREEDRRNFAAGQEVEDVLKIYHAIICEPDDSPAFKEAMRLLAGYILGKD